MKVVALMRWEWQAGDPEKYWHGWQWDGKPGADYDSTALAVELNRFIRTLRKLPGKCIWFNVTRPRSIGKCEVEPVKEQ